MKIVTAHLISQILFRGHMLLELVAAKKIG